MALWTIGAAAALLLAPRDMELIESVAARSFGFQRFRRRRRNTNKRIMRYLATNYCGRDELYYERGGRSRRSIDGLPVTIIAAPWIHVAITFHIGTFLVYGVIGPNGS